MDPLRSSTGLFESPRLVIWLLSQDDLQLAGSEIRKMDGDHQNIKVVAVSFLCNAYIQLNYSGM